MFCPKCGHELRDVGGELTCIPGGMGLSKSMEKRLAECYQDRSRIPKDSPASFRWGGTWYCPGCGVKAEEKDGSVRCPQCRLSMNEFLHQLVELHPHT